MMVTLWHSFLRVAEVEVELALELEKVGLVRLVGGHAPDSSPFFGDIYTDALPAVRALVGAT